MVREPVAAVESYLRMVDLARIHAEPSLRADRIRRMCDWFAHWERRVGEGEDLLVVRYEDLRHDPASAVRQVAHRWDLDLRDEVVAAAVERCSWAEMAARVPPDEAGTAGVGVGVPTLAPEVRAEVRTTCRGRGVAFGYGPSGP